MRLGASEPTLHVVCICNCVFFVVDDDLLLPFSDDNHDANAHVDDEGEDDDSENDDDDVDVDMDVDDNVVAVVYVDVCVGSSIIRLFSLLRVEFLLLKIICEHLENSKESVSPMFGIFLFLLFLPHGNKRKSTRK